MVGLSAALVGGAHLDGWAHQHLAITRETIFTPWHALLYSSLAAVTTFLILCAAWTGARPWQWFRALPRGYGLSLAGCLAFGIGGVLDLVWHLVFGIEVSFQALISPTHLVLMVSAGLIASGPLRAAWAGRSAGASWPAVMSATLTLSMLTFFGQFDHPFTSQWSAAPQPSILTAEAGEELGVLGVLFATACLMAVVLLLARRFTLPFGSLTFLMGVNALFVTLIHNADPVVVVAVVGGFAGDVALAALRSRPRGTLDLRVVAVVVPVVTYALYFRGIQVFDGIWWPVHVWVGTIALAGLAGWLLSWLVAPPAIPEPNPSRSVGPQSMSLPALEGGVGPGARLEYETAPEPV